MATESFNTFVAAVAATTIPLNGAELFPLVQAGITKSAPIGNLRTFANSCAYTLASGTTHNLGPSPTSGTWGAGVTNRLILTPNASGSTIDGITAPGIDGFVIMIYNPSLTLSLTILDQNNAGTSSTAGNLLACPNPYALGATSIQVTLAPQSAQKLTYYSNIWIFS